MVVGKHLVSTASLELVRLKACRDNREAILQLEIIMVVSM